MEKKRNLTHKSLERGKFIRHYIFGAEDGLISTLGFLSGITGAGISHLIIIIVGLAEIFAAALSMGIGTYLSSKSQIELKQRKIEIEKEIIERYPKFEKKELETMYRKKGFKGNELKKIVNKIFQNKQILLKEMLAFELGINPKKFENPKKSAFIMFISFFILAMIPLSPYLVFPNEIAIFMSVILTVLALFLVGAVKTRLTKRNWLDSGLEMMFLGLIAAIITYFVGEFISSLL